MLVRIIASINADKITLIFVRLKKKSIWLAYLQGMSKIKGDWVCRVYTAYTACQLHQYQTERNLFLFSEAVFLHCNLSTQCECIGAQIWGYPVTVGDSDSGHTQCFKVKLYDWKRVDVVENFILNFSLLACEMRCQRELCFVI